MHNIFRAPKHMQDKALFLCEAIVVKRQFGLSKASPVLFRSLKLPADGTD